MFIATVSHRPLPLNKGRPGYILVEAVMSMALLSVGLIAIQGSIRQTIITRGQARDYTQARFLMDQVMAHVELQPLLAEGSDSGRFAEPNDRFEWAWKVTKIDVPEPPMPPDLPPEAVEAFELSVSYVAKIEVTISWTRGGRAFTETFETLWAPEKLFIPKEPEL